MIFPKHVKTGIQILFRNEISHHCPAGESLSCGNYTTHTHIQIATAIGLRTTPKPEMSSFRNNSRRWVHRKLSKWHLPSLAKTTTPPPPVNFLTSVIVTTGWDWYSSNCASTYVSIETFLYFNYSKFHETSKPRTRPRPQEISWNRDKFWAGLV